MTALDALRVVTEQVDAFNAHDLDAFVATYAEDAVVTGVGDAPLAGRDAIRAFYADRLSYPGLSCTVATHALFGERWVVAQEYVVRDGVATETIATFDVRDGLIRRASMVKA